MAAVLPPVLEALLRASQGHQNSAAFQAAMPMGAAPDPRQVSVDGYDPRMAALLFGADPTPRPVTPMDVTPMPVSRQESMANAERILAQQPGAEAHQADLARSAAFINELNKAIQSPDGPVGMRQGAMDEIAMQFPDKAYPVGTTVMGGGDMSYMPRGPMRDGRLSALTTALSGLGAPMGYQAPAPAEPDFMPRENSQKFGEIFSRNVSNLRSRPDIVNREAYDDTQQRMADRSTMARDLITQRASQEANARSLRRSGMDPRTAALLGALGGNSELGQMAAYDAIGGRGAYADAQDRRIREEQGTRTLDIRAQEADVVPSGAGPAEAVDANAALAKRAFDAGIASGKDPTWAANQAMNALIAAGVEHMEAIDIVEKATGVRLETETPRPKRAGDGYTPTVSEASTARRKKEAEESNARMKEHNKGNPTFRMPPLFSGPKY